MLALKHDISSVPSVSEHGSWEGAHHCVPAAAVNEASAPATLTAAVAPPAGPRLKITEENTWLAWV